MAIHPTAIVDPGAELGSDVEVLPYTIIEGETVIGDGCTVGPHAVVRRWTHLGVECHVSTGAVLGEPPQDRKYSGERSYLKIGNGNELREYVTLHRASGEDAATVMGDNNMFMAYCHAGHNVCIGSNCSFANCVQLSGHTVIEDNVTIGGMTGFHQFVTVGQMAMVGGMSRVTQDVPPFAIVEGNPAAVRGLNVIGLGRHGISTEDRAALRKAFRLLFRSEYNLSDALEAVKEQVPDGPELTYLCDFLRRTSQGSMGRQLSHR
jgi:UDP-N-acetylglucosamine acyltransferase